MSKKIPPDRMSSSPSTSGAWGVSRPLGIGVSLATGFVVFAIGASFFPVSRPLPPPPRPPIFVVPPTPVDASIAPEKTGDADAKIDAIETADAAAKVVVVDARAESEKAPDASAATPSDAGEATGPDGGNESDPDCGMADKDIAREAWRRNWPTLCKIGDSGKAFILIPIKGSIEKATGDLKRKPVREARVNLPEAESQLTLKLYKIRRMGFKDLKIGPPEDGPGGVRLRVRLLPGAGDPVFEVKDGYAKITVAMPEKE